MVSACFIVQTCVNNNKIYISFVSVGKFSVSQREDYKVLDKTVELTQAKLRHA